MCGIVGYVGHQNAVPILVEGLHRLEYRGYDSAGLAVQRKHGIEIHKRQGKVREMEASLPKRFAGVVGVGHTRWATHGAPSDGNAHPQIDASGRIAVVHNGIIENAHELRVQLEARGVVFASQTDTEVLAQLIGERRGRFARRRGAHGAARDHRHVRHRGDGRASPGSDRRCAQRQPGDSRHRRQGDVHRVRCIRARAPHPTGDLSRRR